MATILLTTQQAKAIKKTIPIDRLCDSLNVKDAKFFWFWVTLKMQAMPHQN